MLENDQFRSMIYLLMTNVIGIMTKNEGISELEAIDRFYHSETYSLLEIQDSRYWWLPPQGLYSEYEHRLDGNYPEGTISKETNFFILLIEQYAAYRELTGTAVLDLFKKNNLISYIYDVYEIYHIDDLRVAFETWMKDWVCQKPHKNQIY